MREAIAFLTRIPVGRPGPRDPSLMRSGGYFPLVGALVGTVGAGAWWLGTHALGSLAGAVLGVLATVVITGALHEDGLGDTVDGLWGGATVERRLEIMRDSRLGTYGSIAIVGDLLLRVAILAPFGAGDLSSVAKILIASHVAGRFAPLALVATTPHARTDGQGARLAMPSRMGWAAATVTVLGATWWAAGVWAPAVLVAAAVVSAGVRRAAVRRVGGVTGDILGASVAITTLVVAATTALIMGDP